MEKISKGKTRPESRPVHALAILSGLCTPRQKPDQLGWSSFEYTDLSNISIHCAFCRMEEAYYIEEISLLGDLHLGRNLTVSRKLFPLLVLTWRWCATGL